MLENFDLCNPCVFSRSVDCNFLRERKELLFKIKMDKLIKEDPQNGTDEREEQIKGFIEWRRMAADIRGCRNALPTGGKFNLGILNPSTKHDKPNSPPPAPNVA